MSVGKIGMTLVSLVLAAMTAVVFVPPVLVHAQTAAANPSYSATVVNRSKGEIYFKIVGGQGKGFVDGTLRPNFKTSQPLTRGEKVVCIWDKEGFLMAAWRLWVTGNCTITVPDLSSSTHPNYREPGDGVVDMQWDSRGAPTPGSGADLPTVDRVPSTPNSAPVKN